MRIARGRKWWSARLTAPADCKARFVFDEPALARLGAVGLIWSGEEGFALASDRSPLENRPWSPAPEAARRPPHPPRTWALARRRSGRFSERAGRGTVALTPGRVRPEPRIRGLGHAPGRDPGAPAHKVTRVNDFSGLSAPLRNFVTFFPCATFFARGSGRRRGSGGAAAIFGRRIPASAPISLCVGEGKKARKTKRLVSRAKRAVSHRGRKSLKSLGREIGDFAELFVFNSLTAFSFRGVRGVAFPSSLFAPERPRAGLSGRKDSTMGAAASHPAILACISENVKSFF